MGFMLLGALIGFVVGSALVAHLCGPRDLAAGPFRPAARKPGSPGAAFLLLTIAVFAGMAAGSLLG